MDIGGQQSLTYGSSAVLGTGALPPSVSNAAATGPAAPSRTQALMAGAAPVTAAERAWVQQVGQVLQAWIEVQGVLVAEATRQARLGNDINGRPLQRAEDHAYEQRVLDLVNVERARYGLGALTYNRQLDGAAEGHNSVQVATRTMAHDGLGDADPGTRIRATGFTGSWGENVATGQLSPEQVVAEWMASPGHRRNILDGAYQQLGVSYAVGADGRTYWAQAFGA